MAIVAPKPLSSSLLAVSFNCCQQLIIEEEAGFSDKSREDSVSEDVFLVVWWSDLKNLV